MQNYLPRTKLFLLGLALLLSSSLTLHAQSREVTGTVISGEDDLPLPGVSVLVKGTTRGAVTDIDGNYTINLQESDQTIVFSFVGFVSQEVTVGNQSTIDITLNPDMQSLGEVVVVGYGEQKKETITGSVATVKGGDLVKSPAMNLSNSIAGRMSGVIAVNRSGEPGYDGAGIRIRGSNTLGNNDALIVIDGIPARAGGIDRLNPNDIESVDILKDASATAIYGSRGANGVVIIKTKTGSRNKAGSLKYNTYYALQEPQKLLDVMDLPTYARLQNALAVEYGTEPPYFW